MFITSQPSAASAGPQPCGGCHGHPQPAHTALGPVDHPAVPPKALGYGDGPFSGAFQGTSTSPRPQPSEGLSTFPTGLIHRTHAVRILKGNTDRIALCSQSMAPYCPGIHLNTSAWRFKCSMKERPQGKCPAFLELYLPLLSSAHPADRTACLPGHARYFPDSCLCPCGPSPHRALPP